MKWRVGYLAMLPRFCPIECLKVETHNKERLQNAVRQVAVALHRVLHRAMMIRHKLGETGRSGGFRGGASLVVVLA